MKTPRPPRRFPTRVLAPLLVLLLTASFTACDRGEAPPAIESQAPGSKVALIGWDGADWDVARPLMNQGRMPHLQSLVDRGAAGELHSMVPVLSPLLWTTASTGRPPEVHGVLDFLEPGTGGGPPRPITQNARRVAALWEMVGVADRSAGVVGWWATHPVRVLSGFMVSDQLAYTLVPEADVSRQARAVNAVFPAEDQSSILEQVVTPDALPEDVLERFDATDERLREILAGGLTYHRAAQAQLARHGQPDLLMIYYQGIDQASHHFMHCAAPAMEQCEPERRRFGDTVARYYEFQDALLGELLETLEPETVVILISDHGFLTGAARPRDVPPDVTGQPGRWHRNEGLFVLAGPPVSAGAVDVPLRLLEVTPTVLHLLGLPAGSDMEPARTDLLRPGHAEPVPAASWSRWEEVVTLPETVSTVDSEDAQRKVKELTALGYLSGAGSRTATSGDGVPRTIAAQVNLASRWIETGALDAAVTELTAALARSPDYAPAWMGLGEVRSRQGLYDEAARAYAQALEHLGDQSGAADADPALLLRWALVSRSGSEGSSKLEQTLDAALRRRPESADLHVAQGVLQARSSLTVSASRRSLQAALELEPTHPHALATLFALRHKKPVDRELEPILRRAVDAAPKNVMPRNWLALQQAENGNVAEAEALLREAARLVPEHAGTRVNLGNLLGRAGRSAEAAAEFRQALELAPSDLAARMGLATSQARAGDLEAARQTLEAAAPQQRDDIRLLNTLGLVYRDLGRNDRAVDALRRSLTQAPEQPEVQALLETLETPQ